MLRGSKLGLRESNDENSGDLRIDLIKILNHGGCLFVCNQSNHFFFGETRANTIRGCIGCICGHEVVLERRGQMKGYE